ncbi:MAG: DUF885 domain-containing protein [Pseudomonadota bacterium]
MGRKLQNRLASLGLAFALMLGVPACGSDSTTPSRRVSVESEDVFAALARMELSAAPETLTRLGLPGDLLEVDTNNRFGDRSQAAFERQRLTRIEALKLLEEMTLAPEASSLRGHQEMVLRTYASAVRVAEFGHGRVGLGNAYPYVLDHRSGAWVDLPDLLTTRQRVVDLRDAEDFLARMVQLASALEDERLRLLADAEAGILPPRIILQTLALRLGEDLAMPLESDRVILAFEDQVSGLIDETSQTRRALRDSADDIIRNRVRPAYGDLLETVASLIESATDVPGVWTLPDGDAYYDAVLAMHTRADTSAESLHREARARVDALTEALSEEFAALDALALEAEPVQPPALEVTEDGEPLPPLTVGQRLADLASSEAQLYPDTTEARAELEADVEAAFLAASEAMQGWIARQPELRLTVRVAEPRTRLAAAALYTAPTPDGADPGVLRIDATDVSRWPRFAVPALMLHETIPGHHTEASFAMVEADLPLIRQLMWHTGYGEGWATYAETLGLESGLYDDDPHARIGILQSQLFSAARQVVDTGVHRMRWERQEAIDYLVAVTGMPEASMAAEVDRIIVLPGQASAYTAGADQISAIRARARAVVGRAFDPAAFHYTLLSGGPRPLEQVEADMERWYEAQMVGQ